MMLRGILWKEGVNGLGVGRFHALPCRRTFDTAARLHDAAYDLNGDRWARKIADLIFLVNMLKVSKRWYHRLFAYIYYIMVRMFGWAFFRYDNK
jgi:hypothetical protein